MRFRKLAGVVAGGLIAGVLVGPGLVAPAQAAATATKSFLSTSCTYSPYTSNYQSDYTVAVDGSAVTVTFDKPFNPGFGATPTFSYIEPKLVLNIGGQSVDVKGKKTFDPAAAGNSDLAMPVATGTLATPAPTDAAVSLTSMVMRVQINVQAGPTVIHPEADMACSLDKVSKLEMDCSAAGFHMLYPVEAYTRATGTAVSSYLRYPLVPGMPAFLSVASQTPTLKLDVDSEVVTLTGTKTYAPPLPGSSSFEMPVLTGTRTGTAALSTVAINSFGTSLVVNGSASAVGCTVYAPKTTTTTAALTCVYGSFVMPYAATLTTTYDHTNVTATLSDPTFSVMPAGFKVNSLQADLSAKAGSVPITLASTKRTYETPPAGNAALSVPQLTGTTSTTQIPSATSFDLLTLTLNITTTFSPTPSDAIIKCAIAAPTTTTLVATAPAANQVKLAAAVASNTAPGSVTFYEGATKVGDTTPVAAGAASVTLSNVAAGAHSYTAKFTPTEQFRFVASTSAVAAVTVSPAATTTTLTGSSAAPNAVSLAAKVSPTTAGNVEFYEGATKVGTTAAAAGAATLALTGVSAGTHSYTATFVPTDATKFGASTSTAVTVTVAAPGPSAACTAAEASAKVWQAKVKAAETKVKKAQAKVKKAKAKVKKAKGKKAKAAKKALKTAQKQAKASTKVLKTAKSQLTAANNAVKAAC